ncbi:MAG: GlcNAc-transferase family protein [Acidimicrobiales bacterium]
MVVTEGGRIQPDLSDPFSDRRILVSIAADRDLELSSTIRSALTQAAYPEHLRFAICHVYDHRSEGQLVPWTDDPRFVVTEVAAERAGNRCWARSLTYDLFDDEPYVLQISAHTRFAARWDGRYIEMLESIDDESAIITGLPAQYEIRDDSVIYDLNTGVQVLVLDGLNDDFTMELRSRPADDVRAPGPSPLLAANQIFARGRFCRDVPYDAAMYPAGEEISLAVRAFTHGYNFYYPDQNLTWHLSDCGEQTAWLADEVTDLPGLARLEQLLVGDATALGDHGLGTKRTVAQFEESTGISFANRIPMVDAQGLFDHTIELDTSGIDLAAEYQVWIFALLDGDGNEVHRSDITDHDVLRGDRTRLHLIARDLSAQPTHYVLWPLLSDGAFLERRVLPIHRV